MKAIVRGPVSKAIFACALAAVCALLPTTVSAQAEPMSQTGRVVTEQYRLNIGGDVGTYTDWERLGLTGFLGLETTAYIDVVYGKKSDKWDSIGRINLSGQKDGKSRRLSFFFYVDRETKKVIVKHQIDDGQMMALDIPFELKKGIPMSMAWKAPGLLEVKTGEAIYEVACDFDVTSVRALGSGVDVRFEPLVLNKAE